MFSEFFARRRRAAAYVPLHAATAYPNRAGAYDSHHITAQKNQNSAYQRPRPQR